MIYSLTKSITIKLEELFFSYYIMIIIFLLLSL